jgi:hypothetical protein
MFGEKSFLNLYAEIGSILGILFLTTINIKHDINISPNVAGTNIMAVCMYRLI